MWARIEAFSVLALDDSSRLPLFPGRLRDFSRNAAAWLIVALICHALLVSKFTIWWEGHGFGPRLWTEVMPDFLAIAFGAALVWSKAHFRPDFFASLAPGRGLDRRPGAGRPGVSKLLEQQLLDIDKDRIGSGLVRHRLSPMPPRAKRSASDGAGGRGQEIRGTCQSPKKVGTLDRVDCGKSQGWAWDPREPDRPILVEIYGGRNTARDRFRQPAPSRPPEAQNRNGETAGLHDAAFSEDGQPHTIHAKIAGMNSRSNNFADDSEMSMTRRFAPGIGGRFGFRS